MVSVLAPGVWKAAETNVVHQQRKFGSRLIVTGVDVWQQIEKWGALEAEVRALREATAELRASHIDLWDWKNRAMALEELITDLLLEQELRKRGLA